MQVDWADKIDPTALRDAPSWFLDGFLRAHNLMLRSLTPGLRNGLSVRENMNASIVAFGFTSKLPAGVVSVPNTLTSGAATLFKNPLKNGATPLGFEAIYAEDTNGNAVQLASPPMLNKFPRDASNNVIGGYLGLTASVDLQHTLPCLIKTASAAQSINNNLSTAISGWDTATKSRGSVITDDGSTFTVSEAGTYNVSFHTAFQGGVTYSAMQIWIFANGLASYADNYLPVAMTDEPEMQVSGTVDLAAGGTLKALCFQTNAALAARTVNGGTNGRRIMIHRLYNDTVKTVRLLGILWGA